MFRVCAACWLNEDECPSVLCSRTLEQSSFYTLLRFHFQAPGWMTFPAAQNITIGRQPCAKSKNTITSDIIFSFYVDTSPASFVSLVFQPFFSHWFILSQPCVRYISEQRQKQVPLRREASRHSVWAAGFRCTRSAAPFMNGQLCF